MGSPILHIRLLGELDLRRSGASLPPLESVRAESLLAYLLLHREAPQPRQRLAFLFWPDSTERQARTNLRHALHNLRLALPDPDRFLDVTPRTLQWRADAPFRLDVAAFEELVSRTEKEAADGGLAALREAVEMYTGDLLEGSYDEWLFEERERFRQRYLEALARLTALLEACGEHAGAIPYAERLLRHDPLREETYRLLMRLHHARGDRAQALRVYHVCAATLERELGIEPSAPTRELYEALLPQERGPTAVRRHAGRVGAPPLVGRTPEWTRLTALWREAESGRDRLVLVTGEPGIGKTRLVEEFRPWCAHRGAVTAGARSYPAEGALAYGTVGPAPTRRGRVRELPLGRGRRGGRGRLRRAAEAADQAQGSVRPDELLPDEREHSPESRRWPMTKVLVTGATGNVGSRVVQELRSRGVSVRAFVRDPDKAGAVLGQGVELARGDFSEPDSIRHALDGVGYVFLSCGNHPRQVEYETNVIDAAHAVGVRRIVKLSAIGSRAGSPLAFWDWHGRIEQHLRASGLPSVILHPTSYMTNLIASAEAIKYTGKLFAPPTEQG